MIVSILIALAIFFIVIPLCIELLCQKWFWYLVVAPIALFAYLALVSNL